jgi:hypothetical protein
MRIWFPIVLLSTLVTAFLVSGRDVAGAVPLMTIAQIHEDPWAWHGRRVRVVGSFDQCAGYNCRACDEFETHLERIGNLPASYGATSCTGVEFLLGPQSDVYARFNTVLVEAEYDATCSNIPSPAGESWVCMDRASELRAAAILELIEERSVSEFSSADRQVTIGPVSGQIEAELVAAYLQSFSPHARHDLDEVQLFAYLDLEFDPDDTVYSQAGLCECLVEEGCLDRWPTTAQELLNARGNPYYCSQAFQKNDGSWFFPIQ